MREDYSADGDAWNYFPHDMARSRAYRWGEDGMGGFCDDNAEVCFAPAFWNGQDPILKERLFGLSNSAGNHGEDVKEYYSYSRYLSFDVVLAAATPERAAREQFGNNNNWLYSMFVANFTF